MKRARGVPLGQGELPFVAPSEAPPGAPEALRGAPETTAGAPEEPTSEVAAERRERAVAAERLVVPTERHVERAAREGGTVETRAVLRQRLIAALAPDVVFASPAELRVALVAALAAMSDDPLLARARAAGGIGWERTIDAVGEAVGVLHASAVDGETLARIGRTKSAAGRRAAMLGRASAALDAVLARAGLVDPRANGRELARAIRETAPEEVARAVGAARVIARWIVDWPPSDLVWWRALDQALAMCGGGAQVELPSFDQRLDAARERDPLETVAETVARALDAAPRTDRIAARLGDLAVGGARACATEADAAKTTLHQAADAVAQARAVATIVAEALGRGVPVERIAVAAARLDDDAVTPIARALDDIGVVAHDPRGLRPLETGAVATALGALGAASRGLPRADVAALARSRYVDAARITGLEGRAGAASLRWLARALDETPTAAGDDPVGVLAATAAAWRGRGEAAEEIARGAASLARKLGDLLWSAHVARTRREHVAAARRVWDGLGLGRRARATPARLLARDGRRDPIDRAELAARARDARAWELLDGALETYEAAAARLGAADRPLSSEAFVHEISQELGPGVAGSGAARAGAVRIVRLDEIAAERLDVLIVFDANDGVLPGTPPGDPLVSDALASALRERDPARAPATTSLRHAVDLAQLALAASGAADVALVWRLRDEQGSERSPAAVAASFVAAGAPRTIWPGSPLGTRPLGPTEMRLHAIAADPRVAHAIAPRAAVRADRERAREAYFSGLRPPASDDADAAVIGLLAPADASIGAVLSEETGGGARALPITSLESMARCPFQGYARRVLGASERSRRRDLPDAREEGTLVHEALAAAFGATRLLWAERPRDAARIVETAMRAVDDLLSRDAAASPLRRFVLDEVRASVSAVVAFSLADAEWDFALAEQPFGEPSAASWPALVLDDGKVHLALRGKIDRVDVAHDRRAVRAVDYKRSRRALAPADLGEVAFQVPLYARVAARALDGVEAAGVYLPFRPADLAQFTTSSAFAARWAHLLGTGDDGLLRIERAAIDVVARLRGGALAPRPQTDDTCARCGFDGGCRKPRFAIGPADDAEG